MESYRNLLKKARDVLDEYKYTEDGEYNNDEVFEICKEIDLALENQTVQKSNDLIDS